MDLMNLSRGTDNMALTKEILLNAAEEASLQTVLIEIYTQFKKDRKIIFNN